MLNSRKVFSTGVLAVLLSSTLVLTTTETQATPIIFLNAETPATGNTLDFTPLVNHHGTITFSGEIREVGNDSDFIAAGASGLVFDLDETSSSATLSFDFDINAINFIYGGNEGVFDISAYDVDGNIVDSFFQDSTGDGELAGPITLAGTGIRNIVWQDPESRSAAIDNITLTTIPVPGAIWLFASAIAGLVGLRKLKAQKPITA